MEGRPCELVMLVGAIAREGEIEPTGGAFAVMAQPPEGVLMQDSNDAHERGDASGSTCTTA